MSQCKFNFLGIFLLILLLVGCKNISLPAPTSGETEVKKDGDESGNQDKRERWFQLLHQAAPGVDWKLIETQNSFENAKILRGLREQYGSRNGEEWVAGGNILGSWFERGSSNQAGNVLASAYDKTADEIFVVSGGGSLFKGYRSGIGWEVVNQDLRFTPNLMECLYSPSGKRRLVSSINHGPYYSDDEGKTWTPAVGIDGLGGYLYHPAFTSDQKILFLQKRSYWAPLVLYMSDDMGESYKTLYNFNTHDTRNLAIAMEKKSEVVFVIFQQDTNRSDIYSYNTKSKVWKLETEDSPLAFGAEGNANLQVVSVNGKTLFYSYDGEQKLHVSEDFGASWTYLSTLPSRPWSVALFISPSQPNHMIYGEVDAYRSRDAGKTWQKINAWWEYYNNVPSKLHADIMAIREFEDPEGLPFVLISNHGGMSITYDMGIKNENIGLYDLNVSQYYDVKSYPLDHNFIFAGSQDQGFQKGFMAGTNSEPMVQVISGDYGHITFSEGGKRLWTVYPGGWTTYYPNPRSGGSTASFEINSEQESVWIPPLAASPDLNENAVYMAGGNINGGQGSHLVKLTFNPLTNEIDALQFPFNFRTSGGELSAMAFSPFNPKKVYCATTNGKFYISQDGGETFTYQTLYLPGAQYLYGSCILPSNIDSNIVYMSGSGYSSPGVMVSRNGGKTFTSMRAGLPNTMVFELAFNEDESLIYAATEAGPYVFITSLNKWFLLSGSHTPNQTFWSVEYLSDLKIARYGTYGRGIWDFHFKEVMTTSQENVSIEPGFDIFPNPTGDYITVILPKSSNILKPFAVLDVHGNTLHLPFDISQDRIQFDTSALPPGLYFVTGGNQKGKLVQKFIKL